MSNPPQSDVSNKIAPAEMHRLGTVDERFQSYNIEMVEVIGGRFWKPYRRTAIANANPPPAQSSADPVGMDSSLYEQRAPIDLTNPRLRKLAAALGPAYMRVSGTWANTVYFHDSDASVPPRPPAGFGGILTRQQWRGVVDFSQALDAPLVTSFATGAGVRDAAGVWTPEQAHRLLAYTRSLGGSIAAAEYMNEPTLATLGGVPPGYDAADYGRDFAIFRSLVQQAAPDMLLLGPGGVGEENAADESATRLNSADILIVTGPVFDAFSYHFYGALSQRCAPLNPQRATTADAALSEQWLSRTDAAAAFYGGLRDKFTPGKPLWLTETADAACGGNPWAATFLDSFRYLDQLGRLAVRGVQVIMHNTLTASDYGLLDERTMLPRPNYWAALLWRRLMGTTVLAAGHAPLPTLHLYAHSLHDHAGGVALLVLNTHRTVAQELEVPVSSERYTLTAKNLLDGKVQLNGSDLQVGASGDVPQFSGVPTPAGKLVFAPASITFLAMPNANNPNCY